MHFVEPDSRPKQNYKILKLYGGTFSELKYLKILTFDSKTRSRSKLAFLSGKKRVEMEKGKFTRKLGAKTTRPSKQTKHRVLVHYIAFELFPSFTKAFQEHKANIWEKVTKMYLCLITEFCKENCCVGCKFIMRGSRVTEDINLNPSQGSRVIYSNLVPDIDKLS